MTLTARNSKINIEQAQEIRRLWLLPKGVRPTQTEIAKKFSITQAAVSYIVNKKRWHDTQNAPVAETSKATPANAPDPNQTSLFIQYD